MRPPADDPAVITTADKTFFVCWVENVGGRGDRWIFAAADGTRYNAGIYAGEDTLEQLRARVDDWWIAKRSGIA